jgi:hypothetical protein
MHTVFKKPYPHLAIALIVSILPTTSCDARSSGGTTSQTRNTAKPKPPGKPLKKAVSCSPVPIKPTTLPKGTDPRTEYTTGGLFSPIGAGAGGGPHVTMERLNDDSHPDVVEIKAPDSKQFNSFTW